VPNQPNSCLNVNCLFKPSVTVIPNKYSTKSNTQRAQKQKTKQYSSLPISYYFKENSPPTSGINLTNSSGSQDHQSIRLTQTLSFDYLSAISKPSSSSWCPRLLPVLRSSHPFDKACTNDSLSTIKQIALLPPNNRVVSRKQNQHDSILVQDFRSLISPDTPINQQIIHLFLHQFSAQFKTEFLESGFFSLLRDNGWERVHSWVFPRRQNINRSPLIDCPAISIPCHINGCHWIAVTRRIIAGQVVFLYADDMNSLASERQVRQIFANSNPNFYPPDTIWIKCNNFTYLPHSNECGIRTLLALIFKPFILLPTQTSYCPICMETWLK
jgi:hypothetical protein